MGRNKIQTHSGGSAPKAPANSAPAASSEAPVEERPPPTDYFSSLTPEEQELERERMAERQRKAALAKKREEKEREEHERWARQKMKADRAMAAAEKKWQSGYDAVKQEAFADGIVEAERWNDGCYYVAVGKDTWKLLTHGEFWCPHCDAPLNVSSLGTHLYGDRHRRARQHAYPPGLGEAGAVPTPPPPARGDGGTGGSQYEGAPSQEPWQEWDEANQCLRCRACNKLCDGLHETTKEHTRKVEQFMWNLQANESMYKAPVQPWLAWIPDASFGKGRYLRCLLCKKWISDWEELDTSGYNGSHGDASDYNQKDHARRLINLEMYEEELAEERLRWHPETAASGVTASTYARSAAASYGFGVAAGGTSSLPPLPPLPAGWRAAWDSTHQQYYYYADGREAQWDIPTDEARPSGLIEC